MAEAAGRAGRFITDRPNSSGSAAVGRGDWLEVAAAAGPGPRSIRAAGLVSIWPQHATVAGFADVQPGGLSRIGSEGLLADATVGEEPCHLPNYQVLAPKQHMAALVDRQQFRPGDPFGGAGPISGGNPAKWVNVCR
jgi:hypothetical protein